MVEEEEKLPSAVEAARYDFETSVEHMLVDASQDYERLLDVQQKIAIARTNIGKELTRVAEEEDILLVGQRLKSTINNTVRPSERRVRGLVEDTRSNQIIEAVELMSLLKQPFVLQSIASEQRLSPAGIQARLHKTV